MAEGTSRRYAVVSGGNKGIGFGICKQLASNGIVVVLTARDEKRGLEAVQKLKDSGFSDFLFFHQLDVSDPKSIAALANFITTQFGKLDILVNNAGIGGVKPKDAFKDALSNNDGTPFNWSEALTENYELAEECVTINYYGAKRLTEALIPLLEFSDSPRIVNVSSSSGQLKNVSNEWAKEVLSDGEKVSEERIEEVLSKYLKDFKEGGSLQSKGWPALMSGYILSKAAMNAYTRIKANKLPKFRINSVCPGFVKTDINFNSGILSIEEGAERAMSLVLLPNDGPSGCFFVSNEVSPF